MTDPQTVIVEAVDLYRFFHTGDEETFALRGVSLRVNAGEVVAITGPSGSGKSTLISCLAGLDEPDGGTVRIAGETMTRRPESHRAGVRARHVGLLFQSGNLVEHLTVRQNIRVARLLAGRPRGDDNDSALDAVGLAARADAVPTQLSGGELVRAGLAVALANDPLALFADEPTGELDEGAAMQIMGLLRGRAESGACVVLVTHDPLVARSTDREIVLHDGAITP